MKRLVMLYSVLLLCLFCFSSFTYAKTVTGIVYNDKNKNGNLDRYEKGIRSVAVSNGSTVTLTDRKGRYSLELKDGDTLFISKPSGYFLPLDQNNLPQFYFNYAPGGTPDDIKLRYPGLKPSGEIEGDLNFPLYRQKEPDRYDVILISDPQTTTNEELDYFRDRVVAELAGRKAAFGITTGDIMNDDLSLFPRYSGIIGQLGIPWFNVPGNHDINYLAADDSRSLDTFRRHFGPAYYSFNWGKVHYVILDTILYKGTDPEKRNGSGGYITKLDEKQLRWLKADLSYVKKNKLIFLAMHAPIKSAGSDMPELNMVNPDELFEALSGFDRVFSIAGHLHGTQHIYFDADDGYKGKNPLHHHVITTASGTWWSGAKDVDGIPHSLQPDGTPKGYHIMSVRGNKCTLKYKAAGKSDDYQMRITLEETPNKELVSSVPLSRIDRIRIFVNLFDGGEKSVVSLKIDDGKPYFLKNEMRVDTFAFNIYLDANTFISGREIISPHIWIGSLEGEIKLGIHTITVKARDEYGQEHTGRKIFEVVTD
ncbi:calcineurin-like phosphoesterase C-terminal domain-containing protein [Thermodesulfobacteriota bacterium]